MACPYCGSEKCFSRNVIGNKILGDTVEVYYIIICQKCGQDYVKHSTLVVTREDE